MMFPHKRVVLVLGDSIFLEGISVSFRALGDFRVEMLAPDSNPSAVTALRPNLILVDALQFSSAQIEQMMTFFPVGKVPPILRLSVDSERLTVFSSQQFPAASLNELTQAMKIISETVKKGEWI